MPPLEDLPRALWGVQPEAVEQHFTELIARCSGLEAEVGEWRTRASQAESELAVARAALAEAQTGGSSAILNAQREAANIRRRVQTDAAIEKARWEKELRQAEEELATTRAQIDALRKDFLALLEGVAGAVSHRAKDRPAQSSTLR